MFWRWRRFAAWSRVCTVQALLTSRRLVSASPLLPRLPACPPACLPARLLQCLLNSTVGLTCPLAAGLLTPVAADGHVPHYIGVLRTITAGAAAAWVPRPVSCRPASCPCLPVVPLMWSRTFCCLLNCLLSAHPPTTQTPSSPTPP